MKRVIKNIVLHCSAGHSNADKIQDYFLRPKSKGGRGWRTGGYHLIIERDGSIVKIYPYDKITNGVRGHNLSTIHICYVGGVEEGNVTIAKDTRTQKQKEAIHLAIQDAINWSLNNGSESIGVVGHRDFSLDNNGNGLIEPYERIKECPSCDAIKEYSGLYATPDRYNKLPTK